MYDGVLAGVLAAYLAVFVAVTLAVRPEITAETAAIRALGTAALALLHLALAIGPLARLDRRFLPLLWNRRHLGVVTFLVALAHGLFALVQFHALGDRNPLVSLLVSNTRFGSLAWFPFQQLGAAALLVLFVMAATSHDFWLAWLTAPVWKGIHLAVYGAYALAVAHVALGALQDERARLPALLLGCGAVGLCTLHLAAATKERRVDRAVAAAGADGWVEAGRVEEIAEGRAKVVAAGGERVAMFRHEGKVSALSNVCQHQNGPLGEGRILDGCVTCPWHGYQYRPEDGASPPPFRERVPTFRVRVEGGRILLDPRPLPAGTRVEPARFDSATPAAADREAFFVGYLPVPRRSKGFLFRTGSSIAVVFVAVAAILAASQRPLGAGEYEYGVESKLEGLLRAAPVPLLWTSSSLSRGGDAAALADGFRAVPLVGQGKHGVSSDVLSLAGQEVTLAGSWIRRGNVALFEVARAEARRSPPAPPPPAGGASPIPDAAPLPLGRQRLVGEVVDSKCYLGVMKPGSGKGHRDCAVRCISGGAPAAFVAHGADGTSWVLLLVAPSGRPLGPELLDRVAEPLAVDGEVARLGDLALLVAEASSFRRLGENPGR